MTGLGEALTVLRDTLSGVRFPLRLPGADAAGRLADATRAQLDDYLIPRLARLDAPLLVVVGGSTGAGKSTLVNSLVGTPVSAAGARRPTTLAPVLVCHADDAAWFTQAQLLPELGRTRDGTGAGLQVVESAAVAPGLALLDAPDIDSVVEANRALAERLLAAADLWLFVTTATRYADAVPWELLQDARNRGTALAMVVDRMPPGAEDEVVSHLTEMLDGQGLGGTRLFVVPETRLDAEKLLPAAAVADLRTWLAELARDAAARAAVIRQTVDGALAALDPTVHRLAVDADEQVQARDSLGAAVGSGYADAQNDVVHGVRDGALFHGEVLARWQELVGTGELMRSLQRGVGRLRDRIVGAVTGKPKPADQLQNALQNGLATFLLGVAEDAAERTAGMWQAHPAAAPLLAAHPELARASKDLGDRLERLVRDWQRGVLDLVKEESGNRLAFAKASAYAVNGLGIVVMITVFAATAFIPTGAEIAVGAGTTVAAQKVLEAIFGDQAVRRLADSARRDLLERTAAVLDEEADRFRAVLDDAAVDSAAGERLRAAAEGVHAARASGGLG